MSEPDFFDDMAVMIDRVGALQLAIRCVQRDRCDEGDGVTEANCQSLLQMTYDIKEDPGALLERYELDVKAKARARALCRSPIVTIVTRTSPPGPYGNRRGAFVSTRTVRTWNPAGRIIGISPTRTESRSAIVTAG